MYMGGSRNSGKGVHKYKGVCVCVCVCVKGGGGSLCWFYLIFLKYPMKWNYLVSLRPKYFNFIGFLKAGRGIEGTPWTSSRSATEINGFRWIPTRSLFYSAINGFFFSLQLYTPQGVEGVLSFCLATYHRLGPVYFYNIPGTKKMKF